MRSNLIPRKEFNALSSENKALILKLGLEIESEGEGEGENGENGNYIPAAPPRKKESVLSSYACVVETTCKLCQTVEVKVFAMTGTGGLLSSHESSLDKIEGLTVKTRSETTKTCPACRSVLRAMSPEDLIALTIRVAKGEHRCNKR